MAQRGRGKYDVVLQSSDLQMGFSLAREAGKPAVITVEAGPGRSDEQVKNADVPRVIDSLEGGMGWSYRLLGQGAPQNGYGHCLVGYTRAPGGILCPPGATTPITMPTVGWTPAQIVSSEQFEGDIYLIPETNSVLRMEDGTSAPTVAPGLPALSGAFRGGGSAIFNNKMYVGGNGGGLLWFDAADHAWHLADTVNRSRLAVASWRPLGVPTDFLIGTAPGSTARWVPITADPAVDGDWSAAILVGPDASYEISAIASAPQHAYFLRPDGAYDMDELGARTFNIAPWMRSGRDASSGSWGLHVGRGLYFGHAQGLAYVPTSGDAQYEPLWCGVGYGLPWEGPVKGQPVAGTLYNGWLLLGIFDGTDSYLVAGQASSEAYGAASHYWHGAEAYFPGERITHVEAYTPGTDWTGAYPKLLITTVTVAPAAFEVKAYWHSLSKLGSPIQELVYGTSWEPAPGASLFLPADPWDRPSAVKSLLQVDLLTERLLEPDTLTVYAQADEGSYAEQGQALQGSYTSLTPEVLTEGRYIRTRVEMDGVFVLRSLEERAAVSVELREARIYRVILAHDTGLKTGRSRELADPRRRMMDLRSMLGQVVMVDDGELRRGRVLQVMTGEARQLGPAGKGGAWALVVPILVSLLDHPFRFDGPHSWDSDRTWGG